MKSFQTYSLRTFSLLGRMRGYNRLRPAREGEKSILPCRD